MKVANIMICERIQKLISKNDYEAAYKTSAVLTEALRKKAQEKYETVPVDNETGGSE